MLQQELHRLHTFENWVIYIVYEVITTNRTNIARGYGSQSL